MTVISKDAQIITFINVFSVEPANQARLVELLARATDTAVRHSPGFVFSALHRSLDGTRVTMYAQWRTLADYEAMRLDPAPAPFFHTSEPSPLRQLSAELDCANPESGAAKAADANSIATLLSFFMVLLSGDCRRLPAKQLNRKREDSGIHLVLRALTTDLERLCHRAPDALHFGPGLRSIGHACCEAATRGSPLESLLCRACIGHSASPKTAASRPSQ